MNPCPAKLGGTPPRNQKKTKRIAKYLRGIFPHFFPIFSPFCPHFVNIFSTFFAHFVNIFSTAAAFFVSAPPTYFLPFVKPLPYFFSRSADFSEVYSLQLFHLLSTRCRIFFYRWPYFFSRSADFFRSYFLKLIHLTEKCFDAILNL